MATAAEVTELALSKHLPDGWWYDGEWYVNYAGKRFKEHPEFDEIRSEENERRRQEVVRDNLELRKLRDLHGIMAKKLTGECK